MGVCGQRHATAALPPGKTQYPMYSRLSEPVWTGAENLSHTGVRSPDYPDRSKSMYWLSYPSPLIMPYFFRTHFHYFRHTYASSFRFSQNTAYATTNNPSHLPSFDHSNILEYEWRVQSSFNIQFSPSPFNLLNKEGQRIRRDHVIFSVQLWKLFTVGYSWNAEGTVGDCAFTRKTEETKEKASCVRAQSTQKFRLVFLNKPHLTPLTFSAKS